MLPELGQLSLLMALLLAFLLSALPQWGAYKNQHALVATAKPLALTLLLAVSISYALLTTAFLQHDFSVSYVAKNSNSLLPVLYQFSAVWGAHEGSLLLWILCYVFG